ncbi:MAG: hypothetical protein ACRC2H_02880 [Silanimonas sp.]
MPDLKAVLSARFYLLLFVVGVATFLVHEFAHWLAGVMLGHEMVATLNSVTPLGPVSTRDQLLITAAGPLVTVGQALVGFWLVQRSRSRLGFALVYMAFFMRLLATGISVIHPNDEATISQLLGLGTWTVPVVVVAALLGLLVIASRTLRLKLRDQFLCYAVASVVVTLIVGIDMVLWPKA